MKRVRKILAMLLALSMIFSFDIPVAAAEYDDAVIIESDDAVIVDTDDAAAAEVDDVVLEEDSESADDVADESVSLEEKAEILSNNNNVKAGSYQDIEAKTVKQLMAEADRIEERVGGNGSKKADVVFLIDTTGSMSGYIRSVKENLSAFVNYLADKGITVRFGIITFRDITCDGMDSTVVYESDSNGTTWYTSASDTIEALAGITVDGGGDTAETPIDALGYLVDDRTYNWSSSATRCAIVLTDADYKYNNRWGYESPAEAAMRSVARELAKRNIVTSVITHTMYFDDYQSLVDMTGGVLGDISGDYFDILTSMADNILRIAAKTTIGVYVLPGYMGSELYDDEDDEKVWVGTDKLIDDVLSFILPGGESGKILGRDDNGENARVHVDADKDSFGSEGAYEALLGYLEDNLDSDTYTVKFFPYDWLGDLNDSEARLEKDIKDSGYDKIIFVTHSTGGLLASAYIAKSELNRANIEKAVMVAPPLYGTYTALEPLEEGKTSSLDSMLGEHLPAIINNLRAVSYPLIYKWVRETVRNTPTTYQLLPSIEYLKLMPQIYDMESAVTSISQYYSVLKGSKRDLNDALIDGGNRSHKYFRDTALRGDVRAVLNQVNTYLIGNTYSAETPAIAVYSKGIIGDSTKYKEIIYKKDGDGTVMGVSALLKPLPGTADDTIKRIDLSSSPNAERLNHSGLVTEEEGLEAILSCINDNTDAEGVDWVEDELYTAGTAGKAGMSDDVKIIIKNNVETGIRVYDSGDRCVAAAVSDEFAGFGTTEGMIYDDLTEEDGTYLYQIYLPNGGYTVKLFNDSDSDETPDCKASVAVLSRDGYRTATATYSKNGYEAEDDKLVMSLDLTEKVTKENVASIDVDGASVSEIESAYTDWSIEDSILFTELGKTKTIRIEGDDASRINASTDITWTSSDDEVASVVNGTVKAVGYGTATIFASANDGSGKVECCEVTVGKYPVAITINDITMVTGQRIQPNVIFDPVDANMRDMTYTSSDRSIVKVIKGNTLLAVSEGIVEVTGTTENGISETFAVRVNESSSLYVDDVAIEPSVVVMGKGTESAVTVRIVPETALNKKVEWTIADPSVVSMSLNDDNSCTLTGLREGMTKLFVVSDDGSYSDEAAVVVGSILDANTNNRIIMTPDTVKQLILGDKDGYYPIVSASSSDEAVATVDATGAVTAVAPGSALIMMEGSFKGKSVKAGLQIQVTEDLKTKISGVNLLSESVKPNVYKKSNAVINVDVTTRASSRYGAYSTMGAARPEMDVSMAIESAKFTDAEAAARYDLVPVSDGVLKIKPKMSLADADVKALAKSYSSPVQVTISGNSYITPGSVKIVTDKKKPVIKANKITVNSFFADGAAALSFKTNCGEVTEVALNTGAATAPIPAGLTLDSVNKKIVYNGGEVAASNKVELLVKTDEIREAMPVTVTVKVASTIPKFKLSTGSVKVCKEISLSKGLALTLAPKKSKTYLADYNVASISLFDPNKMTDKEKSVYTINNEYSLYGFDIDDGYFAIKPSSTDGIAKSGKLLLAVHMYGTSEVVKLPLKVTAKANISLKTSASKLKFNKTFNGSAQKTIKFTPNPADYNTKDLIFTITDSRGNDASDKISVALRSGAVTVAPLYSAGGKYKLKIYDGNITKIISISVKENYNYRVSASAKGKIDVSRPGSSEIKVKAKVKNVLCDSSQIRIVPYVYAYEGFFSVATVTDAFTFTPNADGSLKVKLNPNGSAFKNGYVIPGRKYKMSGYVTVGGGSVGSFENVTLDIRFSKPKIKLNATSLNLTETNVELPVALVANCDGFNFSDYKCQLTGSAAEFCDIETVEAGVYRISVKKIMSNKSRSGKLKFKVMIPGTTKSLKTITVKVKYKK